MGWKGIVGTSFDQKGFDDYCHTLVWSAWRPSFITVHNTAVPSLAQRPNGLSRQHIANLESFYRDTQGWNAGPHLFVDDQQIWVFTPLVVSGVHSPSFNKLAIGIEMLGNYETEDFSTGRGKKVRNNTVAAMATLCAILGIDPNTTRLHKEDPATTHDCPGKNVDKGKLIADVEKLMRSRHAGDHPLSERAARRARRNAAGRRSGRRRAGAG